MNLIDAIVTKRGKPYLLQKNNLNILEINKSLSPPKIAAKFTEAKAADKISDKEYITESINFTVQGIESTARDVSYVNSKIYAPDKSRRFQYDPKVCLYYWNKYLSTTKGNTQHENPLNSMLMQKQSMLLKKQQIIHHL